MTINLKEIPATKEYMNLFKKIVFGPTIEGHSNIVYSIPKNACDSFTRYLLQNSESIDNQFANLLSSSKFITVQLKEISTERELWEEIVLRISQNNKENLHLKGSVLKNIQEILKNKQSLTFILNNSEILFFNNLLQPLIDIFTINPVQIHFIFFIYKELEEKQVQSLLTTFPISDLNYLPLREKEDTEVLLEKEERWFSYKIPEENKRKIIDLSGNYPSLCRGLLLLSNKNPTGFLKMSFEDIAQNQLINPWLYITYNSLSNQSKVKISKLITNNRLKLEEFSKFCIKTRFVQSINGKIDFFTPLFRPFLTKLLTNRKAFKEEKNSISFLGTPLNKVLSKQEFSIFKLLWNQKKKVVSREGLAKLMWRDNWKTKYSDWAIDRVIFKIRNKIGDSDKKTIQTIKGKGFKLVN